MIKPVRKRGRRPRIPTPLATRILYDCARTCCVCRTPRRPVQIHHLDGDSTNNHDSNLAAICSVCHGEAHTVRSLSQNLTPEKIRESRRLWEAEVRERGTRAMLPVPGVSASLWVYIHHDRLAQFLRRFGVEFEPMKLKRLMRLGAVDELGVPRRQKRASPDSPMWSVYDHLHYDTRHLVHDFLTRTVDDLVRATNPVDLDAIWKRRDIPALLKPGTLCFSQRGFYFRPIHHDAKQRFERRLVTARARRIRLELQISTRDMFGDSAVTTTFAGHRHVACLFVVKSMERKGEWIVIYGTPVAMGTGSPVRNESPRFVGRDRTQLLQHLYSEPFDSRDVPGS
jgi:hypothetical protein